MGSNIFGAEGGIKDEGRGVEEKKNG